MAQSKRRKKKDKSRPIEAKLSRLNRPEGLSLEDWQTILRRQFGREQPFELENVGDQFTFSDFHVTNPESKRTYRVAIRGTSPGDNLCSCPDFATNTLGTCKHIEFTLAKLSRKRKAAAELAAGYQPTRAEVYLRYGGERRVALRMPVDAGPTFRKLAREYFDGEGLLSEAAIPRVNDFLDSAERSGTELDVRDDALAYLAERHDAAERERKLSEAFPNGVRASLFSTLLRVPLYDYQREGVLFATRAGRCLIGDEMGLGKTAQAIATAELKARLFGVERVLVVCPTSLKHQWKNEIGRFTERSVRVVEGQKAKRAEAFADPQPFFKITNYDTIYMDLEAITAWGPDLVILDEAQRIKNWATRTAKSVKQIRSPYAVVLTGTPLENRLEELVSLVQFIDLHRLGPTFRLMETHQIRDDNGRVVGYRNLDQLGTTLSPILIRRKKDQVLKQLPERIESTVFVPLTDLQRDLHTENRDELAKLVAKWRRFKFLSESDKRKLLICLQNMRMACDSSYLLDPKTNQGLKVAEIATLLDEMLEQPDGKVVVFSQWTRMHELLVRGAKARKWGYVFFHGGVPGRDRGKLVERFRDDPNCRIFFSTDAGGVGLNLQFASNVINVDLPWNPAVLNQRIGRVHRLGQSQPVRVVNVVAKGTIEEGMLGVLAFKSSLFSGVLDGGNPEVLMGGTRFTKFMEAVETTTEGIPSPAADESEDAAEAVREFDGDRNKPVAKRRTTPESAEETSDTLPADDPWTSLLSAGAKLLGQLSRPSTNGKATTSPSGSYVRRDERTGETYLRLPVPPPEFVDSLFALLKQFRGT